MDSKAVHISQNYKRWKMLTSGPVVIVQMPERLDLDGVRILLQELEPLLEGHRARIVLDCSQVRYIDSAGVEMMLHCLEEAMKCDGDLKLAALSPESEVMLELMRVARVFEVFATSDEAVHSFNATPAETVPLDVPWYANVFGELGVLKQAS
jgi:anti-sigma B factor antagonist